MLNVLLWLLNKSVNAQDIKEVLNDIFNYHAMLVELTEDYCEQLQRTYQKNLQWQKIVELLEEKKKSRSILF